MQKCVIPGNNLEKDDIAILLDSVPQLDPIMNIHKRIGHGAFSSVYLGQSKYSKSHEKHYAIKHIIPTSHPSRILMELKCLKDIGGKDNVIEVLHCFRKLNHVVLIMPYIQHDAFSDYVGKLNGMELRWYLYNLFTALRRVHNFNIIHRDIKPGNFLYSRRNCRFALIDFGVAQEICRNTQEPQSQRMLSPPIIETPQINCSKKVKRKLPVSSPESNPVSFKRSRHSSSINTDVSAPGSMLSPVVDNSGGFRRSPRKQMNKNSHQLSFKNEKNLVKSNSFKGKGSSINDVQDSPSKHTRLAELIRRNYNNNNNYKNFKLKDHSQLSETIKDGMVASLTRVSQVGLQSSYLSRGTNSTLQEVKTKSGKSILRPSSCGCYGNGRVCAVCLGRKSERAPRAGTPGFRAPEVLLRYPYQTTAVDMWSAGVMLLCLLSGRYPFFRAVDDTTSLAEIATILGTQVMKKAAAKLDKLFTYSHEKPPLDLMKICEKFQRPSNKKLTNKNFDDTKLECDGCKQVGDCICLNLNDLKIMCMGEVEICKYAFGNTGEKCHECLKYPHTVYDLLNRLLDPNPDTRITAEEALKHPFFMSSAVLAFVAGR